jgi:hypothetical protein
MRSQLVFAATRTVQNRYQLIHMTAAATRRMHTPKITVGQTINKVLTDLIKDRMPNTKGPVAVDWLKVEASAAGKPARILVIVSHSEATESSCTGHWRIA